MKLKKSMEKESKLIIDYFLSDFGNLTYERYNGNNVTLSGFNSNESIEKFKELIIKELISLIESTISIEFAETNNVIDISIENKTIIFKSKDVRFENNYFILAYQINSKKFICRLFYYINED
jgi:nitrogenase subunit NifH